MSIDYKIGATPKEYRITLSNDEFRVPEEIYYPAEERRNRREILMNRFIEQRRARIGRRLRNKSE